MTFWDEELRKMLPGGAELFDAHVHLGHDIDGMIGLYEQLEGRLDEYNISRCFMFCIDEPDRHPAFRVPNDRTLAAAERSNGRMVPFVRLDLNEDRSGGRALSRPGREGIKLHPRAQRFALNDERLAPVFELAADRQVPILIHGGRGFAADRRQPRAPGRPVPRSQLIIAHAGIAGLAALAGSSPAARSLLDTSVWSPIDLLDFFVSSRPSRSCTPPTTPTGGGRRRS